LNISGKRGENTELLSALKRLYVDVGFYALKTYSNIESSAICYITLINFIKYKQIKERKKNILLNLINP